MSPEKQQQKLAGHSVIAQKVFHAIPIALQSRPHQIASEMLRMTGSRPDMRTLEGCLGILVDAGLIRRIGTMSYQRVAVSAAQKEKKEAKPMPEKTQPAPALPSALDVLGNLSQRLRDLAQELDCAALLIAETQQGDAQLAERYKQVQALLRLP